MMENPTPKLRLVGLTGSLRRASYSTAILRGLQASLPDELTMDIVLPDLPLYNGDDDGPERPEAVQRFCDLLADADGLVIATPEYNHGIPGVLKNALDWASRPMGKSVLKDLPTTVMSSSVAFTGGVRAQAQVNETLLSVQAIMVPGPQVVIGGIGDRVADGKLTDEASLSFALQAIARLVGVIRQQANAGN